MAGFELTLRRKVSHYIITYYLPSGMFVIVSWISFLVPPAVVPGRMTLLVTVFLVLVNIFNTITTNIPKVSRKKGPLAVGVSCKLGSRLNFRAGRADSALTALAGESQGGKKVPSESLLTSSLHAWLGGNPS